MIAHNIYLSLWDFDAFPRFIEFDSAWELVLGKCAVATNPFYINSIEFLTSFDSRLKRDLAWRDEWYIHALPHLFLSSSFLIMNERILNRKGEREFTLITGGFLVVYFCLWLYRVRVLWEHVGMDSIRWVRWAVLCLGAEDRRKRENGNLVSCGSLVIIRQVMVGYAYQ